MKIIYVIDLINNNFKLLYIFISFTDIDKIEITNSKLR